MSSIQNIAEYLSKISMKHQELIVAKLFSLLINGDNSFHSTHMHTCTHLAHKWDNTYDEGTWASSQEDSERKDSPQSVSKYKTQVKVK